MRRRKVPAWLLDLHRYLGTLSLVFIAVHLGALAADSYVDFGVRELFVPMASSWQPGAVTWGIVAFYLLLLVQISSWMMRRLPRRVWHAIHLSSFALLATATVHGVLAGADRGEPLVQFGALAGITVVGMLTIFRVLNRGEEAAASGSTAERIERLAARSARAPTPPDCGNCAPAPVPGTAGTVTRSSDHRPRATSGDRHDPSRNPRRAQGKRVGVAAGEGRGAGQRHRAHRRGQDHRRRRDRLRRHRPARSSRTRWSPVTT